MGEGHENIRDMKGKVKVKVELLRAERDSSGEQGDGRREPTQIKYS